jgi:low affinity Fe/Cu permease
VPTRPSEIQDSRTRFDHFAERASEIVGQAAFFMAGLIAVIVWIPTILVFNSVDTWQLVISTITSVLAFLLVALLQNSARRADIALHRKLDALTEALVAVLSETQQSDEMNRTVDELRAAVGLEERI